MKKRFGFFTLLLMFSLQACSQEQWVEGEHYRVVGSNTSEKPVVTEFFSFWCPHCYNFEPLVKQIKEKLDEGVGFKKVHVNFMRFAGSDTQDAATKGMIIGRLMDREVEMNQAIFSYIHLQGQQIAGQNELRNIFVAKGISAEEFDKMYDSYQVSTQLSRNNKDIEQYRQYLSGVPNFIVNGKYQATFTRDMTQQDIVDLVVWLSKQP